MANEKYIMMSENPTGTEAFSMNRKAGTAILLHCTGSTGQIHSLSAQLHAAPLLTQVRCLGNGLGQLALAPGH